QVVLLHSDLTPKERRQAWLKLARQPGCVVIGPRSVLFAPVQTIGLIVIDEAHDYAYKQEQAPYYVTSRVAGQLAKIHQARLVLGTATPPVSDYFVFERHKLPIVRMERPATGQETALDISLVDLRDRSQFSTSQWLSNSLLGQLEKAMARREQALLFLNRRGTARVIMCQICGWRATCPRCDLPLTYHGDQHQAVCHTCGH
ncbi:primosomal protein N', partial [Candidatus Saccharibacteria bacterium]|nr:primosomal protein N' [Candidatus Saccharibacteria bacterium]